MCIMTAAMTAATRKLEALLWRESVVDLDGAVVLRVRVLRVRVLRVMVRVRVYWNEHY